MSGRRVTWIGRIPRTKPGGGGVFVLAHPRQPGRVMRSDNLRSAPAWITPQLVRQVIELANGAPPVPALISVVPVATPRVRPRLRVVERAIDTPSATNDTPPRQNDTSDTPVEHARRTEEAGAAAPETAMAVSRPRRKKTMAEKATEFEQSREEREARAAAKIGPRSGRYAHELALYEQPEFQELARIAFKRGVALIDLAGAIDRPIPTVLVNTKRLGLYFGKRRPLADALTKTMLLELADENVPLPALRSRKRKPICEDAHRTARRPGRSAASREPAPPAPQPARAQPNPDRAKIDRANKLRADASRRRVIPAAEAFVDAGKTTADTANCALKIAIRTVEIRRAEEARLADPVERAKTLLQRRYAPVCSMAVYDGDPDLFIVGGRKNVTRDELLELAARYA